MAQTAASHNRLCTNCPDSKLEYTCHFSSSSPSFSSLTSFWSKACSYSLLSTVGAVFCLYWLHQSRNSLGEIVSTS